MAKQESVRQVNERMMRRCCQHRHPVAADASTLAESYGGESSSRLDAQGGESSPSLTHDRTLYLADDGSSRSLNESASIQSPAFLADDESCNESELSHSNTIFDFVSHSLAPRVHYSVIILFADICGFTNLASRTDPKTLVHFLDHYFGQVDEVYYSLSALCGQFLVGRGERRVRMCSGERPIGAAKGKQSDTEALCQPVHPLCCVVLLRSLLKSQ